jgi:hypothetical protein
VVPASLGVHYGNSQRAWFLLWNGKIIYTIQVIYINIIGIFYRIATANPVKIITRQLDENFKSLTFLYTKKTAGFFVYKKVVSYFFG